MSEIVSSFESIFQRFMQALSTDLQTLYSALFQPDPLPEQSGPLVESAQAEDRREEAKPTDPLAPKPDTRTPEEKASDQQKLNELRERQKETGSDEAKAEYEANHEEIQRTQRTHVTHRDQRTAPIRRE